ncbi:MAG: hypothetical protein Kow0037_26530 [Calditrichia bacterium]
MPNFGTLMLLLVLSTSFSFAQSEKSEPFEELSVFFGGELNTNREDLHRYWSAKFTPTITAKTPFYKGTVLLKISFTPFRRQTTNVDFNLIYYSFLWEFPFLNIKGLTFSGGLHFGSAAFQFVNPQPPFQKEVAESEIAAGPSFALYWQYSGNTFFRFYLQNTTIFSHKRIGLTYIGVSSGYRFSTPKWIRKILE